MKAFFDYLYAKLSGFLLSVFAKWGEYKAQKIAAAIVLTVGIVTAFVAFQQVMQALILGLIHVPSSPLWQTIAWTALPDNSSSCISAIVTARVAKFGYQWFVWRAKKYIMHTLE